VVKQVQTTIRRFAMLTRGDTVGVAVSGGGDSVALLHCLVDLAEKFEVSLGVLHVNHGLRGDESDEDRNFVANLAAEMGLPFQSARLDAAEAARRAGDNLEQAARRLRYGWFEQLIAENGFTRIATGHTASDQAETVLFRLFRGAAGAGLAGILPVLDNRIVRPLLGVTRADVTRYLRSKHAAWREDSSNDSADFARNRIRHELLPQLERDWNPALPSVLAHTAEWARGEEEYWAEVVEDLATKYLRVREEGVEFPAADVRSLPVAAARRLIRLAIGRARGTLAGIGFEHVESIRSLAAGRAGRGRADLPGLRATRSHELVLLAPQPARSSHTAPAGYCLEVDAPGNYAVPGTATRIRLKILNPAKQNGVYNDSFQALVDWEKVPKPLYLRNWRAGDRIDPARRGGAKKLKLLFQQGRVPSWDRQGWPVLAVSSGSGSRPLTGGPETVVWTRKFGSSAAFAPDGQSRVVVEIREIERRQNLRNLKRN
jgi:tRNA(Ile)-lysidine synthase